MEPNEVKSSDINKQPSILGTFQGECADSNITNLNGLDITREVWENVFNSEEYRKAIELGHYIGFLGHPEDPNCMDFEHACIVMTEGQIDDNGKIYGTFNLIDTPVGRIVKSFQDAGVQFGISVRGAGDIIDNSVDPDTFVFRGFDLVSFPAYPESIPTFHDIAASSDIEQRRKYKAICSAVRTNIESINTAEAVDILKSQFAEQSPEYKMLEDRKIEIEGSEDIDISAEKINGLMDLYLDTLAENKHLTAELCEIRADSTRNDSKSRRKIKAVKRIMAAQLQDASNKINEMDASLTAATELNTKYKQKVSKLSSDNLIYKQKVSAASRESEKKDKVIASLRSQLSETVEKASRFEKKAANLDDKITRLNSEISAARLLIQEYQDAYASIYANAIGVHMKATSVTCSTSVKELQKLIAGSTNIQPTPRNNMEVDIVEDSEDFGLITL